jgi:hypothetical protein
MTYAFDGEVTDFKEKGLVTPKGGEGEKRYSENKFAHVQKARVLTTTLTAHWYDRVDCNKAGTKCFTKKKFTSPSIPQTEMINIGNKSLPILIRPYVPP